MTNTLAVVGALTGFFGLAVSLLVYLRDAPRVSVYLRFDLSSATDPGKTFAVLTIFNAGRRSIYLEHAHIPPVISGGRTIIFAATMDPILLAEGAPPYRSEISQDDIVHLGGAGHWWRLRVKVWDAARRAYYSRWIVEKPSFASRDAPPGTIAMGRFLNSCADLRLKLLA